ncbi:methionyl-tRNA formyltransferase [Siculibacillus lacustris]|uniref:methionyl-tRNA formyltransferase n=1 Tax=Siculibacillus lacustris TaxID=1549641 RepID=UPI0019D2BABD|nr:methionyl-tRNA formyltransferase [Siculibacillus lacustris]
MRIVFMGTPDFAVPTLRALVAAGHTVVAVYSQPPRPAGRGLEMRPSAVHAAAEAFGLPVMTPTSLKGDEAAAAFGTHGADVAVVVAYGLLLPPTILAIPRFGCLNLHGSALPRWRGAAPIQRAIMAGDAETAVEVMQMEAGLDTGPVAMRAPTPIGADETTGDLHDRLADLGAELMVAALAALEDGSFATTPQAAEGITYARKIEKAEARIDWSRPAREVHDTIRGLSPMPGAWCEATIGGKVERLKLLRSTLAEGAGEPGTILDDRLVIACGTGALRLTQVQRAGGRPMAAEVFRRGVGLSTGAKLG